MADWNLPTLTTNYTDFLDELKARDEDSAKMFDGVGSNLPADTIKWNGSNKRFEKYDGTNWNELTDVYNIVVSTSLNNEWVKKSGDTMTGQLTINHNIVKYPDKLHGLFIGQNSTYNQLQLAGRKSDNSGWEWGKTLLYDTQLREWQIGTAGNGDRIWHAGNVGQDSGLEPDLSTSTRIGGLKARLDGDTLYLANDGSDA